VTTTAAGPARDVLHRADGVQLIGEMAGSGYRVPPSLARRADGQTIQLTPLLYAVLHEVDGRRTLAEVAAAVSSSTRRTVSEDNVRHLVEQQLRPLGLLTLADGSEPRLRKQNPLLGLRFRYAVTDPDRTRRVTDPFRVLFRAFVVVPLLVAFAVVCWWVFLEKGLASATYEAFERPGLLILVFVVTILSAGFHEFGHAAAARYGGATPGVMGFGMYLVWPAFYTDVTDSYRLGRGGRLRTDLGGLYFNAIVAVAITGLWLWLRHDALLLVVATQILQMIRQLTPVVRFDGYHVLADLTGVPDLYARIKPTLLGALPWRWGDPEARLLKPWARVVVTTWAVVVVPLLVAALVVMILALPRLMGTAWAALGKQQDVLATAWADGDLVQATARVLAMVAIVVPVAGIFYMLTRLVRQSALGAWRATTGKPAKRVLAALLAGALMAGVAWAWWPKEDNYAPVQPWERGTLIDGLALTGLPQTLGYVPRPPVPTLYAGQQGRMTAVWDSNAAPVPTREAPRLAMILVPKGTDLSDPEAVAAEGWVFPFDRPLAPGPGDNQAVAINTTDGTVLYDVAFAMVWVEDGADALNRNEAQAWASCTSCAAVAIAFQVVFVLDDDPTDANVAAPQNIAGALNYDCVNCLTYALARQLFVTLDEPLSDAAMRRLDELWEEIAAYSRQIESGRVPLDEVQSRLADYTEQILAIVAEDRGDPESEVAPWSTLSGSTTSPSASPSGAVSPSASTSASPSPNGSDRATTAPSRSSSSSPSGSTSGSASPSPSPSGSSSPSATSPGATGSPTG
jgi:putative peptide zinc metalloprotease protein